MAGPPQYRSISAVSRARVQLVDRRLSRTAAEGPSDAPRQQDATEPPTENAQGDDASRPPENVTTLRRYSWTRCSCRRAPSPTSPRRYVLLWPTVVELYGKMFVSSTAGSGWRPQPPAGPADRPMPSTFRRRYKPGDELGSVPMPPCPGYRNGGSGTLPAPRLPLSVMPSRNREGRAGLTQ